MNNKDWWEVCVAVLWNSFLSSKVSWILIKEMENFPLCVCVLAFLVHGHVQACPSPGSSGLRMLCLFPNWPIPATRSSQQTD